METGEQEAFQIFVNTQTTCFLCLKEVPVNIYRVAGDGSGSEGNCSIAGSREVIDNRCQEFNLRAVLKYLKFNPANVFNGESPLSVGHSPEQLLTNYLSVVLCNECKLLAEKVSDYCVELEALQLKTNHWLEKFSRELKCSEGNGLLRSKLTNCPIAERMRWETTQKCKYFGKLIGVKKRVICG